MVGWNVVNVIYQDVWGISTATSIEQEILWYYMSFIHGRTKSMFYIRYGRGESMKQLYLVGKHCRSTVANRREEEKMNLGPTGSTNMRLSLGGLDWYPDHLILSVNMRSCVRG